MTREEAATRCAELNRDADSGRRFFPRQKDDGWWEIVAVAFEGFRRPGPLKTSTEKRPEPSEPPDPRPAIFRNIPPFGAG